MKLWMKSAAGATLVALALSPLYAPLVAAHAQPPGEAPPLPPAEAAPEEGASRARKVMLTTIVNQMKRDTGITILIDRSVPTGDVAPLAQAATAETLEERLTELAGSLPKGTVWAKVNLPERTRSYNPDAVGDYVLAQAKLFGNVGASTPAGTLEVMGQKLSGDKAQTVSDALTLKTVYILINPNARTVAASGDPLANWANMTPQEREQAAQAQAQQLLAMTPQQRAGVMQQQMQVMGAMMRSMTPEQRQQMFQSIGGAMRMFRGPGGPGGPRGGQ